MIWIAPSEKDHDNAAVEKRLWNAADQFRANSGLIFLRFAEARFASQRAKLDKASSSSWRGSRVDEPAAYHAEGTLYLAAETRFVSEHKKNPAAEISIHGVEKTDATGRLCRLNRVVHGLEGEINSYYDDPHNATGRFDFVLANPPFNVNAVDTARRVSAQSNFEGTPQDLPKWQDHERLNDMVGPGRRLPFGLPRTDNANYLWIQLFHSALNEKGRAGFVMANSASDARASEQELRRLLIESRTVDSIIALVRPRFPLYVNQ